MKRIVPLLLLAALTLIAASQGPQNPTVDTAVWTNPSNAYSQNDTSTTSNYLSTEFYGTLGFTVPTGSTIDGILVETDGFKDSTRNNIWSINLVNLGTCTAKTGAVLGTSDSDTYQTFGGASDTWSCTTITVAAINSTFSVAIAGSKTTGTNPAAGTFHLDHLRVTVYYTESSGKRKVMVVA